jgi:putative copper export protein
VTDLVADTGLGVIRFAGYLGYVLVAGMLVFWAIVWPQGTRDRTLVRLTGGGALVLLATTLATPLVTATVYGVTVPTAVGRLGGVAALLRISALVLVVTLLPDAVKGPLTPRRRVAAIAAAAFIALTLVAQSDAPYARWPVLALVATTGHVFATAAWLGGLVALATVVIPRSHLDALHQVLTRFSLIAILSVVTLTVTGVVHAIAVAGGLRPLTTSSYGLVLLLKIAVFGLMLLLGNQGRAYASRVARRQLEDFDASASPAGLRALAIAIGAELSLALGVLAMTSLLVAVVPVT